jgi:hypothetical protein
LETDGYFLINQLELVRKPWVNPLSAGFFNIRRRIYPMPGESAKGIFYGRKQSQCVVAGRVEQV